MTKAELVAILAKTSGGSRASADRAFAAFVTGVRDALRQGKSVTISGFGTFVVARRAARRGRHPRNGSAITIPGARVPKFRASRALKIAVR
ncbi:MAG TPA: HU family DNA-binding protein [Methylomirabilota bacterium]|nr:HU family DNA-binding protein [Methylomirabilota bacterium]